MPMARQLQPPREGIVDLALLMEEALRESGETWRSGDPVMDMHALKKHIREKGEELSRTLQRIHLQGTDVVLTSAQRRAVRRDSVEMAILCMAALDLCGVLDSEREV